MRPFDSDAAHGHNMTNTGNMGQVHDNSTPESASRRPLVLVDVDGVLCDFIGGVLDIVETVTGKRRQREEIDQFDFVAALGLNPNDARVLKSIIDMRRKFCARLSPFPGAFDGIAKLVDLADIHIVTSPWNSNETWTSEREWWLNHHFAIPHRLVTHTSAKHLIAGDWLVDDKTETCERWQAAHPNGVAVQWITPHNRKDGWTGRATNSWDELCAWVGGQS